MTLVPTQPPWVNKIAHVKPCEPYLKTGVLVIELTAEPKPLGKGHGNAVLHLISNHIYWSWKSAVIKSFPNYTIDENGVVRNKKGKVISSYKDQVGYEQIVLHKENKRYHVRVHRLMAEAFLHPTKEKPFVNHIDGDKLNNNLENLEMCNNSENVQHAYDNGLYKDRRECHPVSVYNGKSTRNFKSLREAERVLGVNRKKIASILKGDLPNHTKFKFKYL